MNNEINLNEVNSAEAIALLGKVENNNIVIQEPVEVIAKEGIATGWTAVSDEERELLTRSNTLGHREIKLAA